MYCANIERNTKTTVQIHQQNVHNNIFTTFFLHVSMCYTSSSGSATRIADQNPKFFYKVFIDGEFVCFLWRCGPTRAMASSFFRFLDHTQRRITVGRYSSGRVISSSQRPLPVQHIKLTTDKRPGPRLDSNPRSQQASGRRPTP